jgi:small conductance mechanosensitive channel
MPEIDLSLESIRSALMTFLPRLGLGLLVYIIARLLSAWASRLIRRSMEQRERDPELIVLLELLTRWGILALGIVLALEQIAPGRFSSLIAGLGIAGFTIGFALQDVAKNFVAGLLLLIQQPFEIGDSIEVSGYTGSVLDISLRATEIRTFDGLLVLIPNAEVFVNVITNYTQAPRRRHELTVGVAPDTDLNQAARVALDALRSHVEGILEDPSPEIIFSNFGESTIDFTAYYWVDMETTGFLTSRDEGIRCIKEAFERAGIDMPFPTRKILMDQSP